MNNMSQFDRSFQNSVYIHAIKEASRKYNLRSGDAKIRNIIDEYGSFEKFFSKLSCGEFRTKSKDLALSSKELFSQINIEQSYKQLNHYKSLGISFENFLSTNYPSCLRDLKNPPSIVYFYGSLAAIKPSDSISIVGTRKASLYGKHSTRAIIQALQDYKVNIVSGLATGIDSEAHINAIENKIPTIAVLGAGLLQAVTPRQYNLFNYILKGSNNLIISEFEPNQTASAWTFAQRNRIIAALSQATIVVEAGIKSGALITASYAQKAKRKVFALPGDLNKESFKGNNKLLAEGNAKAIFAMDSLLNEFSLERKTVLNGSISNPENPAQGSKENNPSSSKLNSICKQILQNLESDPMTFDTLVDKLQINQITLSVNLSILEINGYINKHPGARFSRACMFEF